MKNLFERTSSNWVWYSEYEWRAAEDGTLYLTPTKTAQPSIYDPLAEYQKIVLDAINIGRMGMSKKPDTEIQKIRLVWNDDCATYHTKLYGIRGGVPAEKPLYQRRNYAH